jgi:signal transduction histidine kinase
MRGIGRAQGLRSRLLLVGLLGAVATLGVLTVGFNFVLARRLDADANALVRARASSQLATLSEVGGRLLIGEAPDDAAVDAQTWVFSGRRALERPRAGRANQRAAEALANGPRRLTTVPETDTRLYAVPVEQDGRRVGTLVSGLSLAPFERTQRTALIASAVFAGIILIIVAFAGWWILGRALRPVARMTAEAAEWGQHDLDRRFALGPPNDELTTLAATFDELLDRLAASLRHEQRLTAEISHELRTPLSRVLAQADLALRRERTPTEYREALEQIRRSGGQLRGTIDALLAAARADGGRGRGAAAAEELATSVADAWRPLATERGVELRVVATQDGALVDADGQVAERALAPLVDNACRYAKQRVTVTVRADDGHVDFVVADDGPGVASGDRDRIFEPGGHGRAAARRHDQAVGAGLGLALSRRLARAAGGDVEVETADAGATFRLRLPAA